NTRRLNLEKSELEKSLTVARAAVAAPPSMPAAAHVSERPAIRLAVPGSSRLVKLANTTPVEVKQPDSEAPTFVPPSIPDHSLLRRIGKGAYGEVWLARDAIGTFHAVKVIYRKNFSRPEPYEREFKGIKKFTP